MSDRHFFFGLLKRREVTLPSFRGGLIILVIVVAAFLGIRRGAFPFLAMTRPVGGQILVVEGWIPDYCLREALAVFRTRGYRLLIATGGPLPEGMPYSSFGTHARLAAVTLKALGLGPDSLIAVPSDYTIKDRTYMEGVALSAWMRANGRADTSLDVFTFSAHGRRTRLLYAKALGNKMKIGVYCARDPGYDPAAWWKSSNGVRQILDEAIAYLYAAIFFRT